MEDATKYKKARFCTYPKTFSMWAGFSFLLHDDDTKEDEEEEEEVKEEEKEEEEKKPQFLKEDQ